jgi:hypothetical protein
VAHTLWTTGLPDTPTHCSAALSRKIHHYLCWCWVNLSVCVCVYPSVRLFQLTSVDEINSEDKYWWAKCYRDTHTSAHTVSRPYSHHHLHDEGYEFARLGLPPFGMWRRDGQAPKTTVLSLTTQLLPRRWPQAPPERLVPICITTRRDGVTVGETMHATGLLRPHLLPWPKYSVAVFSPSRHIRSNLYWASTEQKGSEVR